MIFRGSSPVRRQVVTLAFAVLLPLIVLGGFQLYTSVNADRLALEGQSRDRAAEIMRLVDAQILAEIKLGNALASAISEDKGGLSGAHRLAQQFRAASGTWSSVRLVQPGAGAQLLDSRQPRGIPIPQGSAHDPAPLRSEALQSSVDGILSHSDGRAYLPMNIPVRRSGELVYLLTVEIDPSSIHRLALERYPQTGVVSAIVDRHGRFISRSLDYNKWVGRRGSVYLQAAAERGGEGLYKNITLEGVPTYTAYVTSAASGWSTHVALSATPFDAARFWSNTIWFVVALACTILSGFLMWIAFRDLAEARREQQRLLQAQKLEAVGHLTGGIAHDFNNLLTAIIGGLDLFLRRSDPADQDRRFLQGALEAAQRGAKLTSRLLAFSRTQSLNVETVDIRSTLDDMSQLLDQSLGPNIIRQTIIADNARWVSTDRNQLELALLNLAVNGRDAMPDGGTLTVEAKRVNSRRNGSRPSYVGLSVTDTGDGMAPHVRSQAFDPFFTTKDASKGTGLGLAQVYAFARQSGGDAEIVSEPGSGTTVCLLLPLAVDAQPPDTQPDPLIPKVATDAGEGKRILVVDDDDAVRQIIVETLRSTGYVVFESSNGGEALDALGTIDPDLVLLDFLMPGLNGAEVARRAREARPHQKLLMVSGHMDSVLVADAVSDVPVLRKPFDAGTLVQQVAEILRPVSAPAVVTEAK